VTCRPLAALWLSLSLAAGSMVACDGTPGRVIAFTVLLEGRAAPGEALGAFTTSTGWRVELQEARVGLAALRVRSAPPALLAALGQVLVPRARAHGGHGAEDTGVRGELLGPLALDTLAPAPVPLGVAAGSAGPASTFELALGGLGAGDLVSTLRGRATRGEVVIDFEGALALPGGLAVEGLPLDAGLEEGGTLRLVVRADRWLDAAHFERLAPAATGRGPRRIESGDQVALAWWLGLRDPEAFAGTWEPAVEEESE
jgi:hypothetical protein